MSNKLFQGGYRIINLNSDDIYDELLEVYDNETKPLLIRGGNNFRDYFTSVSSIRKINNVFRVPITDVNKSGDAFSHIVALVEPSNTSIIEEFVNNGGSSSVDAATKSSLGVVQIGENINVDNGLISIPYGEYNSLGVVGVDNTINSNNGVLSVSVSSLLKRDQGSDNEGTAVLNSAMFTVPKNANHPVLYLSGNSSDSTTGITNNNTNWKVNIFDDNTFIGTYSSTTATNLKSANANNTVLLPFDNAYLTRKITVDGTTHYIRLPIKEQLLTSYGASYPDTSTILYYLSAYIDFKLDSALNFSAYYPSIEVGASATYTPTINTYSTNHVLPWMRQFNISIKLPNSNTYACKTNEVFVLNNCGYIVTCNIDLSITELASGDAYATYTFYRVF